MNTKNPLKLTYLLSKRLYKKASFLVILLVLLAVSILGKSALGQESSMLKIAVVAKNNTVAASLVGSDGAVDYKYYSADEAHQLLKSGKIDAVFEFNKNFDGAIAAFAADEFGEKPLKITVRERNVFINLALERVFAEVYPQVADQNYYNYADKIGFDDKAALKKAYDRVERDTDIVKFSYYNSDDKVEDTNYLLTPMRGMLATILMFCAFASALYFMTDCENGNMDAVPINKRWLWQVLYTLTGAVNIAIFVTAALFATGLMENVATELVTMLLYIIAAVGLAGVISGLCSSSKMHAAIMPIVTIAILAICPIFLNNNIPYVQECLPTYWYLTAVYNTSKIPLLALYCVLINTLSFFVWKIKKYKK